MASTSEPVISKADEILMVSQKLIQTRGYNGFSYRDIAALINIKSASIHYHFPTKGDLGRALTAQYCDRFDQILQSLASRETGARARLEGYAALFRDTLVERKRLCLCGMLAGEVETVPDEVKVEVARFFKEQQVWLTQVLQAGIEAGEVSASINPEIWATTFLAALEGAMLVSRGLGNHDHFDVVANNLLEMVFAEA